MYKNNPSNVCDVVVDSSVDKIDLHKAIKAVVKTVLTSEPNSTWTAVADECLDVSALCGGITNVLFLVSQLNSPEKVIVRLYGSGTEAFIDRTVENLVFSKLSELEIGPTFYGRFQNGRVEGYLPATALESNQMGDVDIYPCIATAVAEMHSLKLEDIHTECDWLWRKIRQFLQLSSDNSLNANATLGARMAEELAWLEAFVAEHAQKATTKDKNDLVIQGQLFGLQKVLCHNDLLCGNILFRPLPAATPQEQQEREFQKGSRNNRQVFLIDYEYAAYNYRAFDLANHFSEHCGFEYDFERTLPTPSAMRAFLRCYMEALLSQEQSQLSNNIVLSDEFLNGLLETIQWMLLASHLFWGSWALVQASCSTIDFDYTGYAQRRLHALLVHKAKLCHH